MSVQHDDSGHRRVEVEVEVPGTPEEVWKAIATGPGVSSWFVPSTVEERVGGEMKCSFGPGMDSISKVTAWDAPRRLEAESHDLGPEAPPVGTEWIVEAKDGDTCIVRVVHSLFTSKDDWDKELEAWESGWPDFFRILRLYLVHFPGQFGTQVQLSAMSAQSAPEAWNVLRAALGVGDVIEGDELCVEVEGLPAVRGQVERVGRPGEAPHEQELLLRTSEPVPGLTHWFTLGLGEQTVVSVRFYLFGDEAEATAQTMESTWTPWFAEQFPPPA
ncbi:MAG: SRPBCC domain-containing protein [Acidobacteriota bacterium]